MGVRRNEGSCWAAGWGVLIASDAPLAASGATSPLGLDFDLVFAVATLAGGCRSAIGGIFGTGTGDR